MESVAALSLAGNIIQFLQFTTNLINSTIQIHRSSSGSSTNILTVESLYDSLLEFQTSLASGHSSANAYFNGQGSIAIDLTKEYRLSFYQLSTLCRSDCEKLLGIVRKLKSKGGFIKSFRIALKTMMEKDEIQAFQERIDRTQTSMILFICTIASHAQEASLVRLNELQNAGNEMRLNQAAKIDQIISGLQHLESHIQEIRIQNPHTSSAMREIENIEQRISQMSKSQDIVAEEQAILQSLTFRTKSERHDTIPQAHKNTFGWVFSSDKSRQGAKGDIAEWFKGDHGLFWVTGKPGSGKSTFMKFIADDPRTRALLTEWAGPNRLVIAGHYFWSAGTVLQKSENGLLRTLLYDIFHQWPDLIEPLCEDLRLEAGIDARNGIFPWSNTDLHNIIRKIANQDAADVRFCFFIDGLDEYDADIGQLSELCKILTELSRSPSVKICISSRPWIVFEDAFGQDLQHTVYMQDITKHDILAYIRHELQNHTRWHIFERNSSQGDWLIEKIQERASGVFLWVCLVVRFILEGLTNHDTASDIKRRFESIPVELEDFFRRILESVHPFYKNRMSTMLQMAIAADEPLPVMAYDFHNREYDDKDYVFNLPTQTYGVPEDTALREDIKCLLANSTRGLLETNQHSGEVTFLHRTVSDFLETPDMIKFLKERGPSNFDVEMSLLRAYTGMVKRLDFKETVVRNAFGAFNDCYLHTLTENAISCMEEIKHNASSIVAYKVFDELDRTILVRHRRKDPALRLMYHPKAFIRERIIKREVMGFLSWKLSVDKRYFTELGPTFPHYILSLSINDDVPSWQRQQRIKLLQLALETPKINLNTHLESINGQSRYTAWSSLIAHITSWRVMEFNSAESQFQELCKNNLLSHMLRLGADPMAILWNTCTQGCPAFGAYLELAFEIVPNLALQEMYLTLLRDFLNAGASLRLSQRTTDSIRELIHHSQPQHPLLLCASPQCDNYNIVQLKDYTLVLPGEVQLDNPIDKFFNHLLTVPPQQCQPADFIAKVVLMLIKHDPSEEARILRETPRFVKRAFPSDFKPNQGTNLGAKYRTLGGLGAVSKLFRKSLRATWRFRPRIRSCALRRSNG